MMQQQAVRKRLKEYSFIFVGCAIYAFAFECFFQPNNLAMGGFTGVSQIINRLVPFLPVGTLVFIMNIPLMIVGVRKQGLKLLTSSLVAIAVSSAMIDGLAGVYTFPAMEPLLACVYGGVLVGVAMGLLLLAGATTGGTELLARLLKYKFRGLSIGRLCLIIDVIVVSAYALAFKTVNAALYGIVAMYISSLAMDMVVYGSNNAKLAYIISDHSAEIVQWILARDMGVTLLDGKGAYTGDEKKVILCALRRNMIVPIKEVVTSMDPNAFIIVCEAHEVLGEGFGAYSPDSL